MRIEPTAKDSSTLFIQSRHYSPVMPRITKHWLGAYCDEDLVGLLTLGWGTRPRHTIQKIFPTLDTSDYYEIGKMCMDDSMPHNSESHMLSKVVKWMKLNTPHARYLFTWSDGLVGKPGYVYQSSNFLYGGFIWTDTYVSESGEKIHPRTLQSQLPNPAGYKNGCRPTFTQLKELGLSRVRGKQFRYLYPMTKKDRRNIRYSPMEWNLNHPKENDLEWKIKPPGEDFYRSTNVMPFDYQPHNAVYNKKNINQA